MLRLTRALLDLRRNQPALGPGVIEFLDSPTEVLAYTRSRRPGTESLLITLNLIDRTVPIDQILGGRDWGRSLSTCPAASASGDSLVLAPNEGVIWRPK
ncbi:DUF3459 domain-containing protein [Streptomyces sp. bgisy027]|uniref:DUF3459 domain-containing protein n=1 Tax=Streptomyces sp. bgisy027 TaxID=3413770 RepID=UPI003D728272